MARNNSVSTLKVPNSEQDFIITIEHVKASRVRVDQVGTHRFINLRISGWVLCRGAVKRLVFKSQGKTLGFTTTDIHRPDIGVAYPSFPAADHAGFVLIVPSLNLMRGESLAIDARIWSRKGQEYTTAFTLTTDTLGKLTMDNDCSTVEPIIPALDNETSLSESDTSGYFKCYLDSPAIDKGIVIEPIMGAFIISGWALARYELKSVVVHFGDMLVGSAQLGIRRPDIAATHPDWPNPLMSGFSLFIPTGILINGQQKLTLTLNDQSGHQWSESFHVDVQQTARSETCLLRRKVSAVETDICLRVIEGADAEVNFHLLMTLDANEPEEGLSATLSSLVLQTYEHWYLYILPDCTRTEHQVNEALAKLPPKVAQKIFILKNPLCSLQELSVHATSISREYSRYFAQLHAGDELSIDCLMQVAMSNVGQREADFIYGDERRISLPEASIQPFLKPDWSPELLLSMNYIGRLWFASANLMERVFSFIVDFSAASEYERVLRLTEKAFHIRRVPMILSERQGNQTEDSAVELAALQNTAIRRGIQGTVEPGLAEGSYRFRRKLIRPGKVSIIIPTIAANGLIKTCIESIKRSSWNDYEIILIDNIKEANSVWKEWFQSNADKVIEITSPFNWSLFNNIGAKHASGDYLLFLNDDIQVLDEEWLEVLMEVAQVKDVGIVGPYLLYPNNTVQHAGLFLSGPGLARHAFRFLQEGDPGYFGFALTQRNMIGVTGACMMMRREVFVGLGGFNALHSVINNDLDFCLRCNKAGLQVIYTPYTRLIHHEIVSRKALPDTYNAEAFSAEWGEIFSKGDPFFHPKLSRNDDNYSIDTEALREVYAGFPVVHRSRIKRIVIFKLDHIGDFITSLPAIRRIKERFPSASLTAVVAPSVASLARSETSIDHIFEFEFFHARSGLGERELEELDFIRLESSLVPHKFDLAIDLRKHLDTRPILQYSGARFFAGFDKGNIFPWLDFALEWEGDPPWINKRQHVASDLLNLVDAITNGCEENRNVVHTKTDASSISLPASIAHNASHLYTKPVIGIHPASGNEMRQWPAENFAELVDLLIDRLQVHVAIIGGPEEQEIANSIMTRIRHREEVWSLVGMHKLSELPDVLLTLALFVGNNSGPKHIAAGLGIPTVAIHSAVVSTEEWGPLGPNAVAIRKDMNCSPCYHAKKEDCHRKLACLREIQPEDVYGMCLKFLALANHSVVRSKHSEKA